MTRPSWKTQRFALALAAVLALSASYTPLGVTPEILLLRLATAWLPPVTEASSVAVVAIDDSAIEKYGPWPWPRDVLARVTARIRAFSPRAIALAVPLHEPQTPERVDTLRADLDTLDEALRPTAAAWLHRLDTDARLASALDRAGNVVLVAQAPQAGAVESAAALPDSLLMSTEQAPASWREALLARLFAPPAPPETRPFAPIALFAERAAGIGVSDERQQDGPVSGSALVYRNATGFLPGFELALYAAARGLDLEQFTVHPRHGLVAPDDALPGFHALRYFPRPAQPVPVYSLREIMRTDPFARRLRDKTVLVGITSETLAPRLRALDGQLHAPVTWSAQVVNSMLGGRGIASPDWFFAAQRGLLVAVALYLLLVPAAWHDTRGMALSGVLAVLLVNTGLVCLLVRDTWLPVTAPALMLIVAQALLSLAYRRYRRLRDAWHEAVEARIALGNNLHAQGQLDLSMQQFVRCLPAPAALEPLYQLGLEYERRRQIGRAREVYATLAAVNGGYRDSERRNGHLADLSQRFPTTSPGDATRTLVLDSPVMELPVLGRYRLERELGRGAMGTVYLAVDPTIGREVAVKTLPLLEHYHGAEQEAVAQRFFREAEAVGRLDHPNIVSVHDAGKEHDLGYMAMDFASGESLDNHVNPSALLAVWEVLEIAEQVADALHYAHSRKVVHRDIKPANIIYDADTGSVKITDFGVARMLDANRTRTGTILGSPAYMSPEQVAGKKLDGRSDLFSLGVTLYQLLTGSLPFRGDSVATLMYQITRQKAPPLRKSRRGLPVCVGRLVARALHKEPARRFADGAAMAVALRKCRAQVRGGRRKTA